MTCGECNFYTGVAALHRAAIAIVDVVPMSSPQQNLRQVDESRS
jgi:hypothetical protein